MRMNLRFFFGCLVVFALALPAGAIAQKMTSEYSKYDLEKNCVWDPQTAEEADEAQGNCAWCPGLGELQVRFCEGDLRQSLQYGQVDPNASVWNSFGEFNYTNPTVEWRLHDGAPVAAIQRFFIENSNPDTGEPDEKSRGQVLVVSTVALQPGGQSCPAGYVDARANSDANVLARQIADTVAQGFRCGIDKPQFHGNRSPYSGTPTGF